MANPFLFASRARRADARTWEQGPAYAYDAVHALAQLASTGCLASTFYASATEQLETLLGLAQSVDAPTVARVAIHARRRGYMKDAPALLVASLADRDGALFERVFDAVIDTPRMLRTFVQIVRSGVTGRCSLGSRPRRCVRRWLARASDAAIVRGSVGARPSLADVVRMVHPAPANDARRALYAWLLGREYDPAALPSPASDFEAWKTASRDDDAGVVPPDVPFSLLAGLPLGRRAWSTIARNATWHTTRMNLNTFARHDVFADDDEGREMVAVVADRLRDARAIQRARVFPYQLLAAHVAASTAVPRAIREALHDAMELAVGNVPRLEGRVVVCPDVSGSMSWAATGARRGATSAVRCIDVAALISAAVLRHNPRTRILPFEHRVVPIRMEPRNTVMTNAQRLARIGGGGTSLSAPLELLVEERARVDAVLVVSDNQSWSDASQSVHGETAAARLWRTIRRRNPAAKLVCIDIQPYGTTQVPERPDVLNIGGFSDVVFELVADFLAGRMGAAHWRGVLDAIDLDALPAPTGDAENKN